MKSITINGSKREIVGKSSTKALRNAGKVPCVVYGGDNPIHFSADELSFSKLVYTPDAHTVVIELEDGNKINAIIQDIQFHPVNEKILHIDFFQVFDDKEVKMIIPVKFEGNSPGVRLQGGILSKNKRKLFVKALPKNLPDFIKADVSILNLNDKITIEDLKDENYSFIHPDNMVVCQVKISRASIVEEEVEELEEGAEASEGVEPKTDSSEGDKPSDDKKKPDSENSPPKSD